MAKIKDVIKFMEDFAPVCLAENWDNVGLIIGSSDFDVKKILVALDINDFVIDEAINVCADLIITHHPFIFGSIKNIDFSTPLGKRIFKLIKNNISVYSAHTNLDIAENGTNDTLAKIIGLEKTHPLFKSSDGVNGLGRVGFLSFETKFIDFAVNLKNSLNLNNITITGNKNKIIKKVALCTGQGSDKEYMLAAKDFDCDAYVTGDLRYHNAQFANDLDLCVVDVTHYAGEVIIVPVLCDYLNNCSKNYNLDFVCIKSNVDGQTLSII